MSLLVNFQACPLARAPERTLEAFRMRTRCPPSLGTRARPSQGSSPRVSWAAGAPSPRARLGREDGMTHREGAGAVDGGRAAGRTQACLH